MRSGAGSATGGNRGSGGGGAVAEPGRDGDPALGLHELAFVDGLGEGPLDPLERALDPHTWGIGTCGPKHEARGAPLGPGLRSAQLKSCSMIRITPGPMITTNRAGRMHRIRGNTIFTGVCWARASAR
jgi:hypothetical protein